MKNLNSSVARLKRTGGEDAVWLAKLRQAADDVAEYLKRHTVSADGNPRSHRELVLPRRYFFSYWPACPNMVHEWRLMNGGQTISEKVRVDLMGGGGSASGLPAAMRRQYLLVFADDMASGWFEEVQYVLETIRKK